MRFPGAEVSIWFLVEWEERRRGREGTGTRGERERLCTWSGLKEWLGRHDGRLSYRTRKNRCVAVSSPNISSYYVVAARFVSLYLLTSLKLRIDN